MIEFGATVSKFYKNDCISENPQNKEFYLNKSCAC